MFCSLISLMHHCHGYLYHIYSCLCKVTSVNVKLRHRGEVLIHSFISVLSVFTAVRASEVMYSLFILLSLALRLYKQPFLSLLRYSLPPEVTVNPVLPSLESDTHPLVFSLQLYAANSQPLSKTRAQTFYLFFMLYLLICSNLDVKPPPKKKRRRRSNSFDFFYKCKCAEKDFLRRFKQYEGGSEGLKGWI